VAVSRLEAPSFSWDEKIGAGKRNACNAFEQGVLVESKIKMDEQWSKACFDLWSGKGAVDWSKVEAGARAVDWMSMARRRAFAGFSMATFAFGCVGLGGALGWLARAAFRVAEGIAQSPWASVHVGWWELALAVPPALFVMSMIIPISEEPVVPGLVARVWSDLSGQDGGEWIGAGAATLCFASGLACGWWDSSPGVAGFRGAAGACLVLGGLGWVAAHGFDVAEKHIGATFESQCERWLERCEALGAQEGFHAKMASVFRKGIVLDGGVQEWVICGGREATDSPGGGAFERAVAAATDRAIERLAKRGLSLKKAGDEISTEDHERLAWIAAPLAMAAQVEKRALDDAAGGGADGKRPLARRI
jgi:hypothetical protein